MERLTETRILAVMLHQQTVVTERAIHHAARGQFMLAASRLIEFRAGWRTLADQVLLFAR